MEFSSSSPFGFDTDSENSTILTKSGPAGTWTSITDMGYNGNLMIHAVIDSNPDITCPPADINLDGLVNVVDIIALVNSILGTIVLTEDQACSADMNGDGFVNVIDITLIVNIILSGD